MQTKQELRIYAKNLRNNLDMEAISCKILENFVKTSYYKNAKKIALYYPYNSEVNLKSLFEDTSKTFFLPKMDNDDMNFYQYKSGDKLSQNKYGIYEPSCDKEAFFDFDIMIIPALMADQKGYRLGYGKGCYDKFLAKSNKNYLKIVLLPDELFIDKLPNDEFDIPANIIITQTEIYDIKI